MSNTEVSPSIFICSGFETNVVRFGAMLMTKTFVVDEESIMHEERSEMQVSDVPVYVVLSMSMSR